MRRALTILCLTLGGAALLAPAAAAQAPPPPPPAPAAPPPPEPRIRAAVSVAGVDVSNLTVGEAQLRLQQALAPAFARDVVVSVAGRRFRLRMKTLRFAFLADKTARRALAAGAAAPPAPDGTVTPIAVAPAVTFKRVPLKRFVARAAKRVAVAPRNARIRIFLKRIKRYHSRKGRRLDAKALRKAIEAVVADPAAARLLKPRRRVVEPKVKVKHLGRLNPTIVTIDRAGFRLRLFKRLHLGKSYGVAVGMPDYPTPTGLYRIANKQVNPIWTAPNSPWAGELAGQQVAGGAANNPLRARWLGIVDGVGIHGTSLDWSIGTRASHGCIRMTVPDVIDLYRRVPVGTPVLIR